MGALGQLLLVLIDLYVFVIIAGVVMSWLIAFEVVNVRNQQAANLVRLLDRATDPVYRPIRKYVPPIAGIDITPIIVLFGLYLLKGVIIAIFF